MTIPKLSLRNTLFAAFGVAAIVVAIVSAIATAITEGANSTLIIGSGIIGTAIAAGVGIWVTLRVTTPLSEAVKAANRIALGDLATPIKSTGNGEIDDLLQALKALSEKLFTIVSDVRTGTTTVTATASQISRDNTALSMRTEAQAGSLEETASSIEELTATVCTSRPEMYFHSSSLRSADHRHVYSAIERFIMKIRIRNQVFNVRFQNYI